MVPTIKRCLPALVGGQNEREAGSCGNKLGAGNLSPAPSTAGLASLGAGTTALRVSTPLESGSAELAQDHTSPFLA